MKLETKLTKKNIFGNYFSQINLETFKLNLQVLHMFYTFLNLKIKFARCVIFYTNVKESQEG